METFEENKKMFLMDLKKIIEKYSMNIEISTPEEGLPYNVILEWYNGLTFEREELLEFKDYLNIDEDEIKKLVDKI